MLIQEDKLNVESIKKKNTLLLSLFETRLEKVKVETWKVTKLLPNIPTGNITELNEVIYTEMKLVCDKIGISHRSPNKTTKSGWEIRLEGLVKKL